MIFFSKLNCLIINSNIVIPWMSICEVLLTPAIIVTWYHRVLTRYHKLLMAKHIYHSAHMIVNHRHIQNCFNVLGLIFHKCRFLHSEQKFCVVSKSSVKPSTFQCSYHIYRPFDRFTIKKSWKCTFKRMSFLMKLEVINRQLH